MLIEKYLETCGPIPDGNEVFARALDYAGATVTCCEKPEKVEKPDEPDEPEKVEELTDGD